MTYVRQQTSEELAAHMRYLQGLPGWHDPLADHLWQEVEALRAEVAGLKTGYEAYERVNAELKAEVEGLRKAAGEVLSWIEAKHRPPVADQVEHGRMALVRLHALAELDAALGQGEQS